MVGEAWLDHVRIPTGAVARHSGRIGPRSRALKRTPRRCVLSVSSIWCCSAWGRMVTPQACFRPTNGEPRPARLMRLEVFDAPKPPPERVTLSAARLSRARQVMFLVSGEAKRKAIVDSRAGEDIPARAITPHAGVDVLVESTLLDPLTG